jgi:hypothetical protein
MRGAIVHRVTAAGAGPWWFSSDGSGRFDLEPPRGTCYVADDPEVALLEALGPLASSPVLSRSLLDERVLWSLPMPDQRDAADATARGARSYGVTAELSTVAPYDLPQRWARALAGAGFGGLRYRARHDPAGGRCLALFGSAGERRRWKRGRGQPLGALGDELLERAGVVVEGAASDADAWSIIE